MAIKYKPRIPVGTWPQYRNSVIRRLQLLLNDFNARHGLRLRAVKANKRLLWQVRLWLKENNTIPVTPWMCVDEVRGWMCGLDFADRLAHRTPEDYSSPPDPKDLFG